MRAVEAIQVVGGFARVENQLRERVRVQAAFERDHQAIVDSPVNETRPGANGISPEFEFRAHPAHEFGEDDVHGNRVGIETIGSRSENEIVANSSEGAIPPARNAIGCEPPGEIEKVRARNFWDAMPGEGREVHILDALAVNMDVEVASEARNPFDDHAFCAVAFIKERRNDGEDWFAWGRGHSARGLCLVVKTMHGEKWCPRRDSNPHVLANART